MLPLSSGSYELTLKINKVVVDTATVSMGAGKSKTVNFTTSSDTAGTYTVGVNGKTCNFVVKEAPAQVKEFNWLITGIIVAGCTLLSAGIWQLACLKRALAGCSLTSY